jgi:pyrroline-5-carboxylate reductase
MFKEKSLGFIGAGRITYILLERLSAGGELPANIWVSDASPDALEKLMERLPAVPIRPATNAEVASQGWVFVGVHPPAMEDVLSDIKMALRPETVLVSLVPKFAIAKLSQLLNGFHRIIRVIPNAPSIIGLGFNPTVFSDTFADVEKTELLSLFQIWGKFPEVAEADLEKYVVLTAVGPTYFWFQWIELCQLLDSLGLPPEATRQGLQEMIVGSAQTLLTSDLPPEVVTDLVKIKPLQAIEDELCTTYRQSLTALFEKLTPV